MSNNGRRWVGGPLGDDSGSGINCLHPSWLPVASGRSAKAPTSACCREWEDACQVLQQGPAQRSWPLLVRTQEAGPGVCLRPCGGPVAHGQPSWAQEARTGCLVNKPVYFFPIVAVTNYHKLRGWQQLKFVIAQFCSSEGWNRSAGLLPSGPSRGDFFCLFRLLRSCLHSLVDGPALVWPLHLSSFLWLWPACFSLVFPWSPSR